MLPVPAAPLTDNPDAEQHATSGHRRWLGTVTTPRATWMAAHRLFHGNGSKPGKNILQANAQGYPRAKAIQPS